MPRFTRNRGSKRLRLRQGGGRFAKSTVANTFGIKPWVCASCRGINTTDVNSPKPETCHHCKKPFKDIGETSCQRKA